MYHCYIFKKNSSKTYLIKKRSNKEYLTFTTVAKPSIKHVKFKKIQPRISEILLQQSHNKSVYFSGKKERTDGKS